MKIDFFTSILSTPQSLKKIYRDFLSPSLFRSLMCAIFSYNCVESENQEAILGLFLEEILIFAEEFYLKTFKTFWGN